MQPKKLSEKALQVKLTVRRAALVKRDAQLTSALQVQHNDQSLQVTTKLFRSKQSPIYLIMQAVNEVYTYHTKSTLPYVDAGPRLLPTGHYGDYSTGMRHLMGAVDTLLNTHMPHYDQLVQDDILYRNGGMTVGRANAGEYPSAAEFRSSVSFQLRYAPLPAEEHELFDLDQEDKQSFKDHVDAVVQQARADVLQRMLKPLEHLGAKLATPIGGDGSVFRDTAISNVLEGCRTAKALLLDDNDELRAEIAELERLMVGYSFSPSSLREIPSAREQAKEKLDAVSERLAAFF